MKILILAVHYEVTGARYIADAFTQLGHDIYHIGVEGQLKGAWGVGVPSKYIWNSQQIPADWKPDLIIVADAEISNYVTPDSDIPVAVWCNDNHVRNMRHVKADHYFLAHAHGPAQPVTQTDETWLPCAADTTAFQPSQIPWEDREYDVCCIGVMYPRRVEVITALRDAGIKVFAATGLVYEEYAAAYQNSRIALCCSIEGDLAQRVFEGAAMGCAVLTDPLLDLMDDTTNRQLGLSGFFVYENPAVAVVQARALLGDESAMARYGALTLQKIVRERHSWEARCQVVVDWWTNWYFDNGVSQPVIAEAANGESVSVGDITTTWNPIAQQESGALSIMGELVEPNYGDDDLMDAKTDYDALYNPNMKMVEAVNQHVDVQAHSQEEAEAIVKAAVEPTLKRLHAMNKQVTKPTLAYLNLGCGRTHFPGAPPAGHELVDASIYEYPLWLNVDKVEGVGADKTFDLFTYPWPLPDNSFDGALLAHILEHIPHEIKIHSWSGVTAIVNGEKIADGSRAQYLLNLQDGWYAFMSELYRVLTPGAIVHIVSPYGFSDGGITDPSHTRYLTMNTFTHSMTPEISDGSTFKYNNGGINFQIAEPPTYRINPYAEILKQRTGFEVPMLMGIYNNICYDFYVKLKAVK